MQEKVIITRDEKIYRILKSRQEIETKIKELAILIKKDYPDVIDPPILLFVVTGGLYLGVDLSRALAEVNFNFMIDTVTLKRSYNVCSNYIKVLSPPHLDLGGRDLIVVEDLIDEGITMNFLHLYLRKLNNPPRSIQYCTLFIKKHHQQLLFEVRYLGWEIGANWLIGNGMDSDGLYRGLSDVYQAET